MKLIEENPIFFEIINSSEFQRLKRVAFLGTLNYTNTKNYSSRYDHSLSVAYLSYLYCERKNIPEDKRTYIVLAALLHDIGHSCFSHSFEPIFKNKFSITHHKITQEIILSSEELSRIWGKYDIAPSRIVDVLIEPADVDYSIVVSDSINFDTLDGMARTLGLLASNSDECDSLIEICKRVFEIMSQKDDWSKHLKLFDSFWELKDNVYDNYIYDEYARLPEIIMQEILSNHSKLKREHFLLTDMEMLREFPLISYLIKILRSRNENSDFNVEIASLCKRTTRRIRKFVINDSRKTEKVDFNKRYVTADELREYTPAFG